MAVINSPFLYVPDPTIGRPLFNGQIYVGQPDLDPEIIENQKQLNIIQEDGTKVPLGQPFTLSSGGIPIYDGSPVRLDVDGNYSFKILSQNGDEIYYIHNVLKDAPITFLALNSLALTTPAETYDDLLALDPANYSVDDNVYVYGNNLEGRHYKVVAGSASNNPPQTLTNSTWNAASKHWELVAIEKGADGSNGLNGIGTISQIASIKIGGEESVTGTGFVFVDELSNVIQLEAAKVYAIVIDLRVADAFTSGMKFQLNHPAGATMKLNYSHLDADGLGVTTGEMIGGQANSIGTSATIEIPVGDMPSVETSLRVTGDIIMGATAGTITVGFAEETAVDNVDLNAGSWMRFDDSSPQPNVVQGNNIVNFASNITLDLTHAYKYLRISDTSSYTVTVPLNSVVNFPLGTEISFRAPSTGTITLVEGSPGVDLKTPTDGSLVVSADGGTVTIKQISINNWDVIGVTDAP